MKKTCPDLNRFFRWCASLMEHSIALNFTKIGQMAQVYDYIVKLLWRLHNIYRYKKNGKLAMLDIPEG